MTDSDSIVKLESFIESQLTHPQRVSDEIEEKMSAEKHNIMRDIVQTVQKFMLAHNAVLYGGLAINQLLPKRLQFYERHALPDFDCFVDKANEKSIDLANVLVKQGHIYTEVKHAMHEGTFKVFCNFESVADITSLTSTENKIMLANAQTAMYGDERILVASTHYLKAMAYKELALPASAHFRWTKVLHRVLLLEHAQPQEDNGLETNHLYASKVIHKAHSPIYSQLKRYASDNELVLIGSHSVVKILRLDVLKRKANSISVLSNNPDKHVNEMIEIIESKDYRVEMRTTDSGENFVPIKYTLFATHMKSNGRPVKLITVYDSTKLCFAYYKHGHHMYSSLYFEMYMLNIKLFMKVGNVDENCKLLHMLRNVIFGDEERAQIIRQFSSKCYGNATDMLTLRKANWDNKKKMLFYRPKTN